MGSLRMRLERLDGVAYIGPEQSKDALRQVETLRDNCQQGETMLIKVLTDKSEIQEVNPPKTVAPPPTAATTE